MRVRVSLTAAGRYKNPDMATLMEELNKDTGEQFHKLNAAVCALVCTAASCHARSLLSQLEEYSLVTFLPLDISVRAYCATCG